jgi:hypothetical protein
VRRCRREAIGKKMRSIEREEAKKKDHNLQEEDCETEKWLKRVRK